MTHEPAAQIAERIEAEGRAIQRDEDEAGRADAIAVARAQQEARRASRDG